MNIVESPNIQPDFVSLKELANRLGVHYRTVHRAARGKKIEVVRFGGQTKVHRSEVARILMKGF
jgi:excisionase family DNA binding protein